jgi:Icc-related predicted phosphoesterase
MKIKLVSDLHLEMCEHGHGVPDLGEGEVLILGGDILCARHFKTNGALHKVYDDFLKKCADNFEHVLYVAGNHEAYGYNYEGTWDVLKENLPSGVVLLENQYVQIKDWVFIGSTLWTDFCGGNALEMMEARQCMNDYKVIRITPKYRKMQPEDTYRFHNESRYYLEEKLKEFKDQNIWVLTHHGPSYQSVHEKYRRGRGIANGAYVSNLDNLILDNPQIKYWSHGHTHESMNYHIGECRVVCNPRGYYNGYNNAGLNLNFDPNFQIEL